MTKASVSGKITCLPGAEFAGAGISETSGRMLMTRMRLCLTAVLLLGLLSFYPKDAQSKQYFDATIRFDPMSGTLWHYMTYVRLAGNEIERGQRSLLGGAILTIYDEEITSSGGGLVGVHVRYNIYESIDYDWELPEDPTGGPWQPPDVSSPERPPVGVGFGRPPRTGDPMQMGGGGGGGTGGGGGEGDLAGEGEFEVTPIMESDVNYIMSESGRLLDMSGLDLIGEIIDPSRSITVRQVFQTAHPIVLPDYEVHLNESWRAPMSWTIPFVGETMEIPLTYRLSDIRTTFRFRVAAIDFNGILQFDVDVADEGLMEDERGELVSMRKESNIKGDIIIQGRAYVDLDRGIVVALCDTPAFGWTPFVDGDLRGHEGINWLPPGFYATLNFERRDLYTPLGNVIDPRQELLYRIQEMWWYTTSVVE